MSPSTNLCCRLTSDRSLARLLTSCPSRGQGVHQWIFRAVLGLIRHGFTDEEITRLMMVATKNSGRDRAQEIDEAIVSARRFPNAESLPQSRYREARNKVRSNNLFDVPLDDGLRRKIVETGLSVDELREHSPTAIPREEKEVAGFVLDHLFPGNPLICVGVKKNRFATMPKSEIKRPYCFSLIVPSPMSKQFGLSQRGERSFRCLDNVGPRVYLVCEFDLTNDAVGLKPHDAEFVYWLKCRGKTVHDASAALLHYLAQAAPLAAVVDSGGKSLHGWFNVTGWPEEEIALLMRLAVCLGADPMTYSPCQLVRMPGGFRCHDDGTLRAFQRVLFFDPSACAQLPARQ